MTYDIPGADMIIIHDRVLQALTNTTVYTPGVIFDKVVASNFDKIIMIIMINNATQADLEY